MDSNDLERERGITILSKNTAVRLPGARCTLDPSLLPLRCLPLRPCCTMSCTMPAHQEIWYAACTYFQAMMGSTVQAATC